MNRDVEYYKEQICMKVNELQDVELLSFIWKFNHEIACKIRNRTYVQKYVRLGHGEK